jgi:hypothetical protein
VLVGCAITEPSLRKQDSYASAPESISDSLKKQISKEIDTMVKEWDEAA